MLVRVPILPSMGKGSSSTTGCSPRRLGVGETGLTPRRPGGGETSQNSEGSPGSLAHAMQLLTDHIASNATRVSELMRTWDTDGNGLIDRKEFAAAMKALGILFPRQVIDEVYSHFDADGSGTLTYTEIVLKARRMAFAKGFVPKSSAEPQRRMSRVNELWERRNRTVVEEHERMVSEQRAELRRETLRRRDEARAHVVETLRGRRESARERALARRERFWTRKQRDERRREEVRRAELDAYHAPVRFLPSLPEAASIARRTWASDKVRVRTPDRLEEISNISSLSDMWVGTIVQKWTAPSTETVLVANLKHGREKKKGRAPSARDFIHVPRGPEIGQAAAESGASEAGLPPIENKMGGRLRLDVEGGGAAGDQIEYVDERTPRPPPQSPLAPPRSPRSTRVRVPHTVR